MIFHLWVSGPVWVSGLGAALVMAFLSATPVMAQSKTGPDMSRFQRIPHVEFLKRAFQDHDQKWMQEIIASAKPEDMLALFEDEAARRRALLASLAKEPATKRDLIWATLLHSSWGETLRFAAIFALEEGAYAPQVAASLERLGLTREADLFQQAMAEFGSSYPVDKDARTDVSSLLAGGETPNAVDRRLIEYANAFGKADEFAQSIERLAENDPTTSAAIAKARAGMSDEDRIEWLSYELWGHPPAELNSKAIEAETHRWHWPERYAPIAHVTSFNLEMLNGSVHQFFYNSSGKYAPEVARDLRRIGLEKHAKAVERGIALFGQTYPRDTQRRRDGWFHDEETEFDQVLYDLTNDVDDGRIIPAMVAYAKANGILPK